MRKYRKILFVFLAIILVVAVVDIAIRATYLFDDRENVSNISVVEAKSDKQRMKITYIEKANVDGHYIHVYEAEDTVTKKKYLMFRAARQPDFYVVPQ